MVSIFFGIIMKLYTRSWFKYEKIWSANYAAKWSFYGFVAIVSVFFVALNFIELYNNMLWWVLYDVLYKYYNSHSRLSITIILPIANTFCGYILKHISFDVRFHDPGLIMQWNICWFNVRTMREDWFDMVRSTFWAFVMG